MSGQPRPVAELQPLSPALLGELIERCLAKQPDARWVSTLDLAMQLEWLLEGGRTDAAPSDAPAASSSGPGWVWGLAGLVLGAALVGAFAFLRPNERPAASTSRFTLDLPSDHDLDLERWPMGHVASHPVALTPDGRTVIYAARVGSGPSMLHMRDLGSLRGNPIAGTEGGRDPFVSPDGEWIGFRTSNALMRIPRGGGPPQKIADTLGKGYVVAWGADGSLVYETSGTVLTRVAAAGGNPRQVTNHEGVPHLSPQILPDGRGTLFAGFFYTPEPSSERPDRAWELAVVASDLDAATQVALPGSVEWGRYLPTGHLVFRSGGTLMAAPFDLDRLEITKEPVSVLDDVSSLSFASDGTMAYVSERRPRGTLVWVDRQGSEVELQSGDFAYHFPRLSPGGTRVGFDAVDTGEMWIHEPERGTRMRFTTFADATLHTAWSSDGERLTFHGPGGNVYSAPSDGSGTPTILLEREHAQWPLDWSPDDRHLVLSEVHPESGRDLWVLGPDGTLVEFLVTPADEGAAKFSPDGNWIAYRSNESGRDEIYVRPFPGPGGKWLVSTNGGTEPVWSADGTELFYREGDAMVVVDTSLEGTFRAGRPEVLFVGDYNADPIGHPMYDVHPDGRFLMVKAIESSSPARIHVVLNWFDELRRQVPVD